MKLETAYGQVVIGGYWHCIGLATGRTLCEPKTRVRRMRWWVNTPDDFCPDCRAVLTREIVENT